MSITLTQRTEQAEFNKLRAGFMTRVSAPNIPAAALKLAYVIAFKRLNRETRSVFIGQDTLAKELNTSERTIRNLLPILQSFGLMIERGNGRGKASTYRLASDDERRKPVPTFEAERRKPVATFSTERRKYGAAKGGNLEHEKAEASCRPTLLRRTKEENQGESQTLAPPIRSAEKKAEELSTAEQASKKNGASVTGASGDAFDRFWAGYPKRVAKEAARKAFDAAIRKHDIAPDVLIEGAKRYAAERAGQEPRYTKHPTTWLNGGCWQDDASSAVGGPPVIDEHGNEIEQSPPRRKNGNGRWNSWDEIGAELLAEMGAR